MQMLQNAQFEILGMAVSQDKLQGRLFDGEGNSHNVVELYYLDKIERPIN